MTRWDVIPGLVLGLVLLCIFGVIILAARDTTRRMH